MATAAALSVDLAIVLLAATSAGFLAKRTGQPTIIAYILAGVIIGPVVLGVVEVTEITETLAELGLAFLLFLLGIKMRISEIRHILAPIVKISAPQMAAVAIVGIGVSMLLGFGPIESVLIGLAVMYSSTAVVIKMLNDRDEATTTHGKIDVGVLLAQDIVVVILLAVLAAGRPDRAIDVATTLVIVLILVAAITVLALAGSRYLLPSVFRRIADDKQIFFLVAISWAFLFIFIADEINLFLEPIGLQAYLSIEMGAFLAGVAIAQLPYSKELQDRVNPLTDLFVMIFFTSIALSIEAGELLYYWQEAVIVAVVLMPAKFVIFFVLINWQRFDAETTFLGSLYMIQVSEFGVVVGVAAMAGGFIGVEILGFLTLVALITMGISVYLIEYGHSLFDRLGPYVDRFMATGYRDDTRHGRTGHAVVIGYDDVTRHLLRLLEDHFEQVVVVDRRVDHVHQLEEAGYETVFGDIASETIQKDVSLSKAAFVLSSSDQFEINQLILAKANDRAAVIVEAKTTDAALDLYRAGADYVIHAVNLSTHRLAAYLEALIEDPTRFDRAIERDTALLRDPEPFQEIHKQMEVGLDD